MHRVGIIGSGGMANTHARHWPRVHGAEIAAVASLDEATAQKMAQPSNARVFGSIEELLANADVDIIDICTPTYTHKDIALKALAAGKHTFLEKPMGRTVAECDEIVKAKEAAGVKMMVGQVLRFFPEFAAAKRQIASGALGTVAAARTARLAAHPKGWQEWYTDPDKTGGVILDMIIHDFDWLRWSLGEVDRVFAKGLYKNPEYSGRLDYGLVTLHFKSGAIGHVCGSWAHTGGFRTQFEVCGDGGMIEHDNTRSTPLTVSLRQSESSASGVAIPESPLFESDDPYYNELKHFVESIDSDTDPAITLQDARAAVAIGCAALESIETGKVVAIAHSDGRGLG